LSTNWTLFLLYEVLATFIPFMWSASSSANASDNGRERGRGKAKGGKWFFSRTCLARDVLRNRRVFYKRAMRNVTPVGPWTQAMRNYIPYKADLSTSFALHYWSLRARIWSTMATPNNENPVISLKPDTPAYQNNHGIEHITPSLGNELLWTKPPRG
jgi:hypothetical protein